MKHKENEKQENEEEQESGKDKGRKKKEERKRRKKKKKSHMGERLGHETGRHGSDRSKNQIDVSLRARCVVIKQS